MNIWDFVLTAGIAVSVVLAVSSILKRKKSGKGCCGDCSKCGRHCN